MKRVCGFCSTNSSEQAAVSTWNIYLLTVDSFGDAVIGLIKASLLDRLTSYKSISIHRLIQATVLARMLPTEQSKNLDIALQILFYGFPNTWNGDERTHQQGHGWASWETCSAMLPHVTWLIKLTEENSLSATNQELFAELVFRAGT